MYVCLSQVAEFHTKFHHHPSSRSGVENIDYQFTLLQAHGLLKATGVETLLLSP
jgi:hypothetical protein